GSTLTSYGGDVSVSGDAPGGNGLLFWTANGIDPAISSTSGAVSLASTGLHGLGLGGLHISTDSGDITIVGTATDDDATAAVFVSSAGLSSNGGDISITGNGGQTGVWLYQGDIASNGGDITVTGEGSEYGVQVWENLLSSGAGGIFIYGTATGTATSATGISVRDAAIEATSGDIVLVGDAQHGTGVFFGGLSCGPGSSVTTTSGDITVDSTGLSGLDVTDVPFTTDSGGITLRGTALGDDFGVYIGAGGLSTNGGDINILGYATSYTGVFINGGDIASHGGDIVITGGSTEAAGVQISDSDIDSGGGDIDIGGDGGV